MASEGVTVNAESVSTTQQSSDIKYEANVVVERKNGDLNITGRLNQSSTAAGCAEFAPLRRSAVDRCGGEVTSLETMQLCLRRNQGQACMDAYPNDPVKRNACIGCISQAMVDPRLHGSSAHCGGNCGCGSSTGHKWFFAIMMLIVLVFLVVRACQGSGSPAPAAPAAQ